MNKYLHDYKLLGLSYDLEKFLFYIYIYILHTLKKKCFVSFRHYSNKILLNAHHNITSSIDVE